MLQGRGVDAKAIAGDKGQFDVVRDGELIYSKRETGQFPDEAEIASLVGA
jgi:predicted Rdx family selenoprotein